MLSYHKTSTWICWPDLFQASYLPSPSHLCLNYERRHEGAAPCTLCSPSSPACCLCEPAGQSGLTCGLRGRYPPPHLVNLRGNPSHGRVGLLHSPPGPHLHPLSLKVFGLGPNPTLGFLSLLISATICRSHNSFKIGGSSQMVWKFRKMKQNKNQKLFLNMHFNTLVPSTVLPPLVAEANSYNSYICVTKPWLFWTIKKWYQLTIYFLVIPFVKIHIQILVEHTKNKLLWEIQIHTPLTHTNS